MNQRHTEYFGPDLARGPFPPNQIESGALQIATALAQLRAPLARDDAEIEAHAEFIRGLADRLAPDWAASIRISVGAYAIGYIPVTVAAVTGSCSVLECWLADSYGGGPTNTAPDSVTWTTGTVLETITTDKHYRLLTPTTGYLGVTVGNGYQQSWYLAVARQARVYYSYPLQFV
ncbi:MAG: hypothetical protein PVJ57_17415 [Phycisphaerae bacterium]|jgi:hypothetical protein